MDVVWTGSWDPPMDHRRGAVGSQYRPSLGEAICERVRRGCTIRQITADPDMPSPATLFRWTKVHPRFAAMYAEARAESAAYVRREAERRRENRDLRIRQELQLGLRKRAPNGGGARCTYTPKAARAVCRKLAQGWSLSQVAADPALPSAKAIYGWLRRYPEFAADFTTACEMRRRRLTAELDALVDDADPKTRAAFERLKRKAARMEGRIGRLTPKLYKADPEAVMEFRVVEVGADSLASEKADPAAGEQDAQP